MKINIVCPSIGDGKILDRLARMLADYTGWPLTNGPVGADLNYNIVYIDLAQRFSDWRKHPWAAYFSHYETGTTYKEFWWKTAERLATIKTYTADQYGAMLSGKTIKVTPPVDRVAFDIRERKAHSKPRIGFSGFIDPSGRKGERLAAMLAGDLSHKIDFVASGAGWPVKTVNKTHEGLASFYNSLDALVCTSTIEGIPMPPLEALSCGVAVVIPVGVGMLDELPDMPGIYRYPAGDYAALSECVCAATKACRGDSQAHDREALRAAVSAYTPEAWAESHRAGFEAALNSKVSVEPLAHMTRDQHGQRGVYYVAYGVNAMQCATGAIQSFKANIPDIPVAIVSEKPTRESKRYRGMIDTDLVDAVSIFEKMKSSADVFIDNPDVDIGGREAKVKIYDLAPGDWQYIAYLDADTEIIAASEFLWQVIEDGWDMVICRNPGRFHIASQMRRSDNGDECDYTFRQIGTDQLLQLNGGVFAFQRNERTKAFFTVWHEEWLRYGKRDQGALLRALFRSPVRLYVLGNEWNTVVRYDPKDRAAWLLHHPMLARSWRRFLARAATWL